MADEVGPLTPEVERVVTILSLIPSAKFVASSRGHVGHPRYDRQGLATAFIAKAVLNLQTTRQLLDRLQAYGALRQICGWREIHQLPHEATFSRAFAEFAETELAQKLHAAVISVTQKDRLVGHICRDSTAIEARERFDAEPRHKPLPARKLGRPVCRLCPQRGALPGSDPYARRGRQSNPPGKRIARAFRCRPELVGGGVLKIVNNTVPQALIRLGYSPGTIEDAPICSECGGTSGCR